MKVHKLTRTHLTLVISAWASLCSAWAGVEELPPEQLLTPMVSNYVFRVQKGELSPRQRWNLSTTVGAYLKVGQRSPKWDAPVKEAMAAFAITRGLVLDAEVRMLFRRVGEACVEARSLGCHDPMVEELYMRFFQFLRGDGTKGFDAGSLTRAATELGKSQYPDVRKYNAWIEVLEAYCRTQKSFPQMQEACAKAQQYLKEALTDKKMTVDDAYAFCDRYLHLCKNSEMDFFEAWKELGTSLDLALGKSYLGEVLKGEAYIEWAWAARGHGYADTVTEEGWKLMRERVMTSSGILKHAWDMDNRDWHAPTVMLKVLLLASAEEEVWEMWFQRAMKNNTNNVQACCNKLLHLYPKWGGSEEEVLAFGRQCLTNQAWGPLVAQVVLTAYEEVNAEHSIGTEPSYLQRPEVWRDVKATFLKILEAYPGDPDYQAQFLRWAVICQKLDDYKSIAKK
jgi:hypothetical protein